MRGLTQAELADRAGVSKESIHRWESGKVSPQAEYLHMLAQAFGVSMRVWDTSVPLDYAMRDEWKEGERWSDPHREDDPQGITLRFRGRVVFEWERHDIRIIKIEDELTGCCQLVLVIDMDKDGSSEFKRSIQSALNQSDS